MHSARMNASSAIRIAGNLLRAYGKCPDCDGGGTLTVSRPVAAGRLVSVITCPCGMRRDYPSEYLVKLGRLELEVKGMYELHAADIRAARKDAENQPFQSLADIIAQIVRNNL